MKKIFLLILLTFVCILSLSSQIATAAAAGAAAGAAGGSWMPVIGTVAGAVLGGAVAAFGSWLTGKKSNEAAEKLNKENLAFQKQQFAYQQFLNKNQFQMMSSDAQKAGINPIAMSGGNVQSSSFSGSSAEPDYSGYASSLGQVGSSIINSSANLYAQRKQIEADNLLQSKSIQSQEKIASDNNKSAEEIERIRQAGENQRNQAIIAQQNEALKSAERISNAKIRSESDLAAKQRELQKYLQTLNQWATDDNQKKQLEYLNSQLEEIKKQNNFNNKMELWRGIQEQVTNLQNWFLRPIDSAKGLLGM